MQVELDRAGKRKRTCFLQVKILEQRGNFELCSLGYLLGIGSIYIIASALNGGKLDQFWPLAKSQELSRV